MPRTRLAVALLVPEPWRREIDGLRRALGDGALGRIAPHVTVVPPVNVRDERRSEALTRLREAAAPTPPLALTIGPVATFWPDSPVLYLAVSGPDDDLAALRALRDRLFREPFHVDEMWPFVPHVTVAGESSPARIERAVATLDAYRAEVLFTHVTLLEAQGDDEGGPRRWAPVADVELGAARVVGRGGLPLELTVSSVPDEGAGRDRVAVTARRDGVVVGRATGRVAGRDLVVEVVEVVEGARREGVGTHLARALERVAAERGCDRLVAKFFANDPEAAWLEGIGWRGDHAADLGFYTRELHR